MSVDANTNGDGSTFSQLDSPISSDLSSKPSSHNSDDEDAPVLTPIYSAPVLTPIYSESDGKKRKADDEEIDLTPGGDYTKLMEAKK